MGNDRIQHVKFPAILAVFISLSPAPHDTPFTFTHTLFRRLTYPTPIIFHNTRVTGCCVL